MLIPILSTKLHIPASRAQAVARPHLLEHLKTGLARKLILVSAPAGFGKTTLISEWIAACECPTAWLSLDNGDADPNRFLMYFIAALQTIDPHIGEQLGNLLQSPQPPPMQSLITILINELSALPDDFVLVLDDYHVLDSPSIDEGITFLLDHLPPQLHLVITTREDPPLPLPRLRARGQLLELRAVDLRFSVDEAAEFLNQVMNLNLSPPDIAALETRTEGWIAGLQLAALSMQGQEDITSFIESFTGTHHFILDYLLEEVLHQQPKNVQHFLLQTSVLDRLCGSLCDTLLNDTSISGQSALEYLAGANLFLVPLDNERRWYRYHHLFGDLLRQRLRHHVDTTTIDDLHLLASQWYEANGFEIDALQHAIAGHDIERAIQLIEGTDIPLYFRGAARPVLNWLESLSRTELDAHPVLWVMFGWALMIRYQNARAEEILANADAALLSVEQDAQRQDLFGQISALRAMLAANRYQTDGIISYSQHALDQLDPQNLYVRAVVMRSLAIAYQFRGERPAAKQAYAEAIALSETSGNLFINIISATGLGMIEQSDNQLHQAAVTYQRVLELVGDPRQPIACAAFSGLAEIHYEWNDLDKAWEYGQQGVNLARQIEIIDNSAAGEIFLAIVRLAQGDPTEAMRRLLEVEQVIHQRNFALQIPVVAAAQVRVMLHQGDVLGAERIAQAYDTPLSQARVYLAQDKPAEALALLAPRREQMEAQNWQDEQLKIMVLQALAYQADDALDEALTVLSDALSLAIQGGFVRLFLDEGLPMWTLLREAQVRGIMSGYTGKLIAAFAAEQDGQRGIPASYAAMQPLVEPLSERELEVLQLVADGLSNQDIGQRLFLALDTVKGHNRRIYAKLGVQRRTEAVARARELGLI